MHAASRDTYGTLLAIGALPTSHGPTVFLMSLTALIAAVMIFKVVTT